MKTTQLGRGIGTYDPILIILAITAAVFALACADMAIDEPGCPAARGLDL